jgi:hypothetical protein
VCARDRTIVTIPNAEFSSLQIENSAKRDRFWYHPTLSLRYETTPDQLRYVLVEVRRLLYAHPQVDSASARIRFVGFGSSPLDLEVFNYVTMTDSSKCLEIAEDLNLRIMDIVAAKEEIEALLPPTIFFFVALHIVSLVRVLMLKGTGIATGTSVSVTVMALILGRAVLLADLLPFINRYPTKPLIYNMVWKTVIYTLVALLVHTWSNSSISGGRLAASSPVIGNYSRRSCGRISSPSRSY